MNRAKPWILNQPPPTPYLSSKTFAFSRNFNFETAGDRYFSSRPRQFFDRGEKERKKERKSERKKFPRRREIYKYSSDAKRYETEYRIHLRIEESRGGEGEGSIPLKKSSHPGVISVYSGMTRRILSRKPVSSAPSRISAIRPPVEQIT